MRQGMNPLFIISTCCIRVIMRSVGPLPWGASLLSAGLWNKARVSSLGGAGNNEQVEGQCYVKAWKMGQGACVHLPLSCPSTLAPAPTPSAEGSVPRALLHISVGDRCL